MFYGLSVDSWLNEKINLFVALGPVTKLTNTIAPLMKKLFGTYQILSKVAWAYDLQHSSDDAEVWQSGCIETPWLSD